MGCAAGRGAGAAQDGLLASRGLWNGLQALKGGRTLLPPPPPFLRAGCRRLVGPPQGALELHRPQLWALQQLLWPPLEGGPLERIAMGSRNGAGSGEDSDSSRNGADPPPQELCERTPPPWVDRERPPLASPTSTEYPPRCVSARDTQRMNQRICKWPARSEEVLEQQPKLGGVHPPADPPPSNRWRGPPSPNRTMYLAHPSSSQLTGSSRPARKQVDEGALSNP